MIINELITVFDRDLNKLKFEIESYKNPAAVWKIEKSIANSGGNLCLHLVGNLNAYIGVGLANTNYLRKRDLEFSRKNIPQSALITQIEETMVVVHSGLSNLTGPKLSEDFPIVIWEKPSNMAFTLIHLATHLNYHLGQINYHRRLLDD
ncbi:DUF1572 family protein [Pollutibacter soli]|uniref:DUF1572 family protein n=1 Tax=Pollutibacter soli TaxID=3034157 RepID=UPI003013F7B2